MTCSGPLHQGMDARAELSCEEAYVILEPYFVAAMRLFQEYCEALGLGKQVTKTVFECTGDMHDTERHFAGATTDGRFIRAAPQMADLPEDTVAAIFAHEFGHILDHLYPGQFVVAEEALVVLVAVPGDGKRSDQARVARMRQWERRDDGEIELVADLIAEQATGNRIGYSGPCMLQGLNRGVRRPADLR